MQSIYQYITVNGKGLNACLNEVIIYSKYQNIWVEMENKFHPLQNYGVYINLLVKTRLITLRK